MYIFARQPSRWFRSIGILVASLLLLTTLNSPVAAQSTEDSDLPQLTNRTCPVQPDDPVDPELWVDYEGERVYFCCRMCKVKFERDPQAYVENLPQFVASVGDSADSVEDNHHAASEGQVHGAHDEHEHAVSEDAEPPFEGHAASDSNSIAVAEQEDEHDHAAHEPANGQTGLARLLGWFGNFHPPSVSFPIALLISAAFAELLLILTGRTYFDAAARFCVWLGSIGAVGATVLGWFFAGFRFSDGDWIMTLHRWLGTAAGVWAILVLLLCLAAHRQQRWRLAYRVALMVGATTVAVNGYFGGAMIYGLSHYAW